MPPKNSFRPQNSKIQKELTTSKKWLNITKRQNLRKCKLNKNTNRINCNSQTNLDEAEDNDIIKKLWKEGEEITFSNPKLSSKKFGKKKEVLGLVRNTITEPTNVSKTRHVSDLSMFYMETMYDNCSEEEKELANIVYQKEGRRRPNFDPNNSSESTSHCFSPSGDIQVYHNQSILPHPKNLQQDSSDSSEDTDDVDSDNSMSGRSICTLEEYSDRCDDTDASESDTEADTFRNNIKQMGSTSNPKCTKRFGGSLTYKLRYFTNKSKFPPIPELPSDVSCTPTESLAKSAVKKEPKKEGGFRKFLRKCLTRKSGKQNRSRCPDECSQSTESCFKTTHDSCTNSRSVRSIPAENEKVRTFEVYSLNDKTELHDNRPENFVGLDKYGNTGFNNCKDTAQPVHVKMNSMENEVQSGNSSASTSEELMQCGPIQTSSTSSSAESDKIECTRWPTRYDPTEPTQCKGTSTSNFDRFVQLNQKVYNCPSMANLGQFQNVNFTSNKSVGTNYITCRKPSICSPNESLSCVLRQSQSRCFKESFQSRASQHSEPDSFIRSIESRYRSFKFKDQPKNENPYSTIIPSCERPQRNICTSNASIQCMESLYEKTSKSNSLNFIPCQRAEPKQVCRNSIEFNNSNSVEDLFKPPTQYSSKDPNGVCPSSTNQNSAMTFPQCYYKRCNIQSVCNSTDSIHNDSKPIECVTNFNQYKQFGTNQTPRIGSKPQDPTYGRYSKLSPSKESKKRVRNMHNRSNIHGASHQRSNTIRQNKSNQPKIENRNCSKPVRCRNSKESMNRQQFKATQSESTTSVVFTKPSQSSYTKYRQPHSYNSKEPVVKRIGPKRIGPKKSATIDSIENTCQKMHPGNFQPFQFKPKKCNDKLLSDSQFAPRKRVRDSECVQQRRYNQQNQNSHLQSKIETCTYPFIRSTTLHSHYDKPRGAELLSSIQSTLINYRNDRIRSMLARYNYPGVYERGRRSCYTEVSEDSECPYCAPLEEPCNCFQEVTPEISSTTYCRDAVTSFSNSLIAVKLAESNATQPCPLCNEVHIQNMNDNESRQELFFHDNPFCGKKPALKMTKTVGINITPLPVFEWRCAKCSCANVAHEQKLNKESVDFQEPCRKEIVVEKHSAECGCSSLLLAFKNSCSFCRCAEKLDDNELDEKVQSVFLYDNQDESVETHSANCSCIFKEPSITSSKVYVSANRINHGCREDFHIGKEGEWMPYGSINLFLGNDQSEKCRCFDVQTSTSCLTKRSRFDPKEAVAKEHSPCHNCSNLMLALKLRKILEIAVRRGLDTDTSALMKRGIWGIEHPACKKPIETHSIKCFKPKSCVNTKTNTNYCTNYKSYQVSLERLRKAPEKGINKHLEEILRLAILNNEDDVKVKQAKSSTIKLNNSKGRARRSSKEKKVFNSGQPNSVNQIGNFKNHVEEHSVKCSCSSLSFALKPKTDVSMISTKPRKGINHDDNRHRYHRPSKLVHSDSTEWASVKKNSQALAKRRSQSDICNYRLLVSRSKMLPNIGCHRCMCHKNYIDTNENEIAGNTEMLFSENHSAQTNSLYLNPETTNCKDWTEGHADWEVPSSEESSDEANYKCSGCLALKTDINRFLDVLGSLITKEDCPQRIEQISEACQVLASSTDCDCQIPSNTATLNTPRGTLNDNLRNNVKAKENYDIEELDRRINRLSAELQDNLLAPYMSFLKETRNKKKKTRQKRQNRISLCQIERTQVSNGLCKRSVINVCDVSKVYGICRPGPICSQNTTSPKLERNYYYDTILPLKTQAMCTNYPIPSVHSYPNYYYAQTATRPSMPTCTTNTCRSQKKKPASHNQTHKSPPATNNNYPVNPTCFWKEKELESIYFSSDISKNLSKCSKNLMSSEIRCKRNTKFKRY